MTSLGNNFAYQSRCKLHIQTRLCKRFPRCLVLALLTKNNNSVFLSLAFVPGKGSKIRYLRYFSRPKYYFPLPRLLNMGRSLFNLTERELIWSLSVFMGQWDHSLTLMLTSLLFNHFTSTRHILRHPRIYHCSKPCCALQVASTCGTCASDPNSILSLTSASGLVYGL